MPAAIPVPGSGDMTAKPVRERHFSICPDASASTPAGRMTPCAPSMATTRNALAAWMSVGLFFAQFIP
ncbi:hypothetical protein AVM11_07390 [Sphingomonas melonis TY]|uniref:Uncharacterized protein n=1 Tax=Sphingomonas melonis TY TaxID=621456 RepID=A0A175Y1F1_9SPHN|nr:hypothetical protein CP552_13305 [Sphingomonas melonis]KZB94279.1 hypothetical protein AVM11_07390 [Sphingomonas melonis TY]